MTGQLVYQARTPAAPVCNSITWTLNHRRDLTVQSGSYQLTLSASGSGITDLAGNLLIINASDAFVSNLIPGDGNGDGQVDGVDYTLWADNFLRPGRFGPLQGDFNSNGLVDGVDYTILSDYFLRPTTSLAAPAAASPGPALAATTNSASADTAVEPATSTAKALVSARTIGDENLIARRQTAWAAAVDLLAERDEFEVDSWRVGRSSVVSRRLPGGRATP